MQGLQHRGVGSWHRPIGLLAALACFLVMAVAAAAPARPEDSTIVLRLPATMTADQVKALLEELQAKGAAAEEAPKPEPERAPIGADVVKIGEGVLGALRAAPQLLTLPSLWE